jgi:hypothetical protein
MADRVRRVDGSTDTDVRPAEQPAAEEPRTRRLRFPSALTVLALIVVAVWVASFFVPCGVYELARRERRQRPASRTDQPTAA